MGDLKEWDSLGNFNLILAIEQKYGIRFKIEDLDKLTSIKEIQKFLHDNLSKQ
jgi:acyl carrier protein